MARALGTTDEVTACDCCGKSPLKLTVIMELDDGEIVHYGTTCARRNTGKGQREITSEIAEHARRTLAAAQAEFKATPEAAAERAAFDSRPRNLVGRAAMEWVREACAAADVARKAIAAKHGIPGHFYSLSR